VIVVAEAKARTLPEPDSNSDVAATESAATPAETETSQSPESVPPSPLLVAEAKREAGEKETSKEAAAEDAVAPPPSQVLVSEAKAAKENQKEQPGETQLAARVEAVPMAAQLDAGLAAYLARDYRTAMAKWLPPAEANHAEAQFYVGGLYRDGSGVAVDLAEAYFWWSLAARQGHGRAKRYLEALESELLPAELAQAKRRSDDWKPPRR
jgi:TPR repeat protein